MSDHNWEADRRPLADCLKEWQVKINGGREYGARQVAAKALGLSLATYNGYCAGRKAVEGPIRKLMTIIDRTALNDKSPRPENDRRR